MDLTFAELIDTVVKPYEEDEAVFISGVPLERNQAEKLKIVEQDVNFGSAYYRVHND